MTTQAYFPNKMVLLILKSMEEILGQNGVNVLLNSAHLSHRINHYPTNDLKREVSFSEISKLFSSLESFYGARGGRGLAIRIGRTFMKYGWKEFSKELGLGELSFRLLPVNEKIVAGVQAVAGLFNQLSDQRVQVVNEPERILWVVDRCPYCAGRKSDTPVCHLMVGILQEALHSISAGKNFEVTETTCLATGGKTCTLTITKKPLD